MKSPYESSSSVNTSGGENSCWSVALRATLAFLAVIFLAYVTVGF